MRLINILVSLVALLGDLRAIGGTVEMVAGGALLAVPEPTLTTKVAGVAVVAHGADQTATGFSQLWTGEETSTLTSQALLGA